MLGEEAPSSLLAAIKKYPQSAFVSAYFAVYGLVIAILKDVPDIEGDKKFNILSYSVQRGASSIFR